MTVKMLRGGFKQNEKSFIRTMVAREINDEVNSEELSDDDNEESEMKEDALRVKLDTLSIVENAKTVWRKTPPMTQVYLASSVVATVLTAIVNSNRWPEFLEFNWFAVLAKGQIWRFYTSFLYFGALDVFYPLTLQFVWQHMSQLEKLNYKRPAEFLCMVLFGAASLIGIYSILGVSPHFLGHNLATYMVYIWSRVFEGTDVNFMDLVTLKSEMIPWFFCLQSLVLEREIPVADLLGIAVGHVYYYLKQKKLLEVPAKVNELFSMPLVQRKYEKYKSDFE